MKHSSLKINLGRREISLQLGLKLDIFGQLRQATPEISHLEYLERPKSIVEVQIGFLIRNSAVWIITECTALRNIDINTQAALLQVELI